MVRDTTRVLGYSPICMYLVIILEAAHIGTNPSNLDLTLTPQGVVGGHQILVATHPARAYTDSLLAFNVNRDNAMT